MGRRLPATILPSDREMVQLAKVSKRSDAKWEMMGKKHKFNIDNLASTSFSSFAT